MKKSENAKYVKYAKYAKKPTVGGGGGEETYTFDERTHTETDTH